MLVRFIPETKGDSCRLPESPDLMTRAVLIHQALEHWDQSDVGAVAERVKRLEVGVPKEDHFIALATWLGRCELIHKLGQNPYPTDESTNLRVPDLYAVFNRGSNRYPVSIEVKSTSKLKLDWRPDYLDSLRKYGSLTEVPVLLACYWDQLDLWTLNDLSCFTRAQTNYHLKLEQAMKDNLMGVLAGDFLLYLHPGFGIHFECEKLQCQSMDPKTGQETWDAQVNRAYVTAGGGEILEDVDEHIWALLWYFPYLEERGSYDDRTITHSLVVSEHHDSMWGQQAVPLYTDGGDVRWSEVLRKRHFPLGENKMRRGALGTFNRAVAKYVVDVVPHTWPAWLPEFRTE